MGEGFEKAFSKAKENGDDLIIGEYHANSNWRIKKNDY
jgi:hypothetical protein